jgi:hypothetical protein
MQSKVTNEVFEISDEEKALVLAARKEALKDAPVSMADLTPDKINGMKPTDYKAMMEKILAGKITD